MAVGRSALEDVGMSAPFGGAYRGRRAVVTGHTGFKGAWLATWLQSLGCEVTGFALAPTTSPALATSPRFASSIDSRLGDVRDRDALVRLVADVRPDFVFHLAAQSLVRSSYEEPAETFDTNVGGTVNVLEAIRRAKHDCSVVVVTTDKCYENREWIYGYRETDTLGGRDPYGASKAAAEIATAAYARSFFDGSGVALSTVRAGNVVGGGDFARDRILPDAVRAFAAGEPLVLRNPAAVRPWQYVLEPLAGYMTLAARQRDALSLRGAWNFGPEPGNERSVGEVAELAAQAWGNGRVIVRPVEGQPHEANMLRLDSTKARTALGWKALLGLDETIQRTVGWYRSMLAGADSVVEMRNEILAFTERARSETLRWTEA